ncbi:MAG: phage holin family protein [Chitinophagales bacterium]|nr:phage holin family protein [Chitinophagales bacterium]
MKQIKILLEELIETCSSYIQARMRLTVLQLSEKTSKVASDFLTILILIIFFLFAFIMLNVGLAKWISHGLNNEWGGFFIMGGFYILLGIILMVMKEKLIRVPLLNAIIKSFFSVEKKAEDKVENIEQSLVNKLDPDSSKKKMN